MGGAVLPGPAGEEVDGGGDRRQKHGDQNYQDEDDGQEHGFTYDGLQR